jgi:hypothetical protein
VRRANVWVSCTSQRGGEITNPGRGGSSLNRWTSHNSSELERGTVPRQTRAVLAQATDMRSSRQAKTLRATADEPTLLGSDGRPEGSTVRRPEGVSVLASQLQVIHRVGSGNYDSCGSCNTFAHGCPDAVDRRASGYDSILEAFRYNRAHGSFAASPCRAAAIPMI